MLNIGTSEKELAISNKNGVDINSDKKIRLRAKGDIIFGNGGFVSMQSKAQIHLDNGMGASIIFIWRAWNVPLRQGSF